MPIKISLEKLLEAGAHFGHHSKRWNPKMATYLYGVQDGIHVFDLIKTKSALEEALTELKKRISEGKVVLLLGTKKQIKDKVAEIATGCNLPFVTERWLGGTLTNFEQIKKSTSKLTEMKAKMASGDYAKFTKKERLLLEREIARLERFFGGVVSLTKIPDAIFVIDTHKESGAVREAKRVGVEVFAIVDSNADPTLVDYPIPMNDDATKALEYVLDLVKQTILEGQSPTSRKATRGKQK